MPTTIFSFLSDEYQHEMKQRAEANANRFEDVMSNYKRIFWDEFTNIVPIQNCELLNPKIEHLSTQSKNNLHAWVDCFHQTIVEQTNDLQSFFDSLIDIYMTYISGNITLASQKFDSILTQNNLYDQREDFERSYPITFRGRLNAKYTGYNLKKLFAAWLDRVRCVPKTPDYFYHIPFDKLHFIKNYRFSMTGQAFIYLGASIPTVLLELRSNIEKNKDLELSYWGIKPGQHLKIYDISNFLFDLINLNIIPIFKEGVGITCNDEGIKPNIRTFTTDFKKFILCQFCTFKKKDFNGQIFVEQYVLPQLLTEQIRNYKNIKYDGFIFPSTQYLNRVSTVGSRPYYGLFKNNIALFTDYSQTNNYDEALLSKFEIVTIDKSKSVDATAFIVEYDKVKKTMQPQASIQVKLKLLKEYYETMKLDNVVLTQLKSIKLQFYFMLDFIKRL